MAAHARAQALRALLARCSTKCPVAAATSSSCLRRGVPSRPASTSYSRIAFPASRAASVLAAQTRSLSSKAQGGAGPGETGADEEEHGEAEELVEEWEEDEDELADPEVVRLRSSPSGARSYKCCWPCS